MHYIKCGVNSSLLT